MIIVIRPRASKEQIAQVISEVEKLGYTPAPIHGVAQTVVAAIGDERTHANLESLTALPQVESVLRVQKRYKLASRESHPENTVVNAAGIEIGGERFCLMAGPCSVESEEQLLSTASTVKEAGATVLRGGAYKPRTSPYEFQGLGREGLRLLALARPHPVAIPRVGGRLEPLCAVYGGEAVAAQARASLALGSGRMSDLMCVRNAITIPGSALAVPGELLHQLHNVNDPSALAV